MRVIAIRRIVTEQKGSWKWQHAFRVVEYRRHNHQLRHGSLHNCPAGAVS